MAIIITYPLAFQMTTHTSSLGDEYLIIWIQNWVIHALSTNPLQLFNANIFYPYQNSLAFSDVFITTSIFAMPFLFLVKEPVITFNITLLLSIALLGFAIFCLAYYVTKNILASFLAGILVIFSPVVLDKMTHIQILAIWGVPFAILFFIKFIDTKKFSNFIISVFIFILQTYNSFLPGYFIIFSYVCIFVVSYCINKKIIGLFIQKKVILTTIAVFFLLAPLLLPYYFVSEKFEFKRDIRDAIHLGLQPEDLLVASSYSRLQGILGKYISQVDYTDKNEVKVGFIGGLFSLLSIVSIIYLIRRKKERVRNALFFLWISIFGLIVSFGPALHLFRKTIHDPFPIILPYAVLYYSIPGFNGLRNAARFEMLFVLGMSVCVALFLSAITKKWSMQSRVFFFLCLFMGVIMEFHNPDRFVPIQQKKEFPKVYQEINTLVSNAVIIELPIYTWYMSPYSGEERVREYYATAHFRKMVNGASGFSPLSWEKSVVEIMQSFPTEKSLKKLHDEGITHLIVHKDQFDTLYKNNFMVENIRIQSGDMIISTLSKSNLVFLHKQVGLYDYMYAFR